MNIFLNISQACLRAVRQVLDRMLHRTAAYYNSLIAACGRSGRGRVAATLLPAMLAAGLRPTRFTFAPLLSATSIGLDEGIRLHSMILKFGFLHSDAFSGTALLGLYARYGSLTQAYHLFDEMPARTIVTWNSMIAAFSRFSFNEESMSLFRQLLASGIGLTECSFLSILPALSDNLQSVELILGLSLKTAMNSFLAVANALLCSLFTCFGVHTAERLFNSLPIRDVVSWNTIIAGLAKSGMPEKSLELFQMMLTNKASPTDTTIVSAINACVSMNSAEYGVLIHAKATKYGLDNNVFVASSLINFYASWRRLEDAQRMFDGIPEKNVVCWNCLISGYSKTDSSTCVLLFKSLLRSEVRPNELSFSSMLPRVLFLELQQLHSFIIKLGYTKNHYISSALIASYDSHGIPADLSPCISGIDAETSTATMNAIASIYNRDGQYEEAQELLFQLQSPDTFSWNILLNACARNRDYSEAFLRFKHMQAAGHSFDSYTAMSLLSICSRINSLALGGSLHGLIVKTISCCCDTFVCNMLMDMYAKCGSIDGCVRVFEEMGDKKNLISWTALVSGLGLHGRPHEALASFKRMKSEGFEPDRVALLAALSACRHGGLIEAGMHLFESMKNVYGIEPEMDHYVCVVDMLCNCGQLKEAEMVISGMPFQPNGVLWRTFLQGCKRFGGFLT